ncbi:unnamed protein product, partial [Owenia fusiformis]
GKMKLILIIALVYMGTGRNCSSYILFQDSTGKISSPVQDSQLKELVAKLSAQNLNLETLFNQPLNQLREEVKLDQLPTNYSDIQTNVQTFKDGKKIVTKTKIEKSKVDLIAKSLVEKNEIMGNGTNKFQMIETFNIQP